MLSRNQILELFAELNDELCRVDRDEDDILLLYQLCGYSTVAEGLEVIERYYPNRPIEAKVRFYHEGLLETRSS
jgi:hypothetical protein